MALGVVFGLYMGIYFAFVGGIINILDGVQTVPLNSYDIAVGVAKVVFCAPIGYLSGLIVFFFGWLFVVSAEG